MADSSMEKIPLTQLSRRQRRVLGTLLEKAFTTPDQYPLTLKAVTTGCNQKNNRDPVTNYDEDTVAQTLEELREMGFVGVLHTETGRTERYRHYLRHRTELNERQLAIMTELMLRGRQQLGELRTRASRMVAIDSQDVLRQELTTLLQLGIARANAPLERRGAEVDHDLFPPGENHEPLSTISDEPPERAERSTESAPVRREAPSSEANSQLADLAEQVRELRQQLAEVKDELADLKRQIGG